MNNPANETMDDLLLAKARNYLDLEQIVEHKIHIEKLLLDNNMTELKQLVGKRLTFGTAGIRGRMGPGFAQMNELVIIQTTQGLVSYLLECRGELELKERGVIIGHDARYHSARFSRLAALAFLNKGIPVYLCDQIVATPLVAFGVKQFSCVAGIVITASHNPKDDNGYKVYWSNGAQIKSPHDQRIQAHIEREENLTPWPGAWQHDELRRTNEQPLPAEWQGILFRVYEDLLNNYFFYIARMVGDRRLKNQSSNLRITYTAMHGVGHAFLSRALYVAGFDDIIAVEQQKKPDGQFPTVKMPNPEESGALRLAFETAWRTDSNLILATDPDADRCAAALFDPATKSRRTLTGNELGSLLGWWLWMCRQPGFDTEGARARSRSPSASTGRVSPPPAVPRSPDHKKAKDLAKNASSQTKSLAGRRKAPENCFMLTTAVSSKFLQSMAKVEGFQFRETLTGFKYMGNLADELLKQGKEVIFAYEEAIGYMVDAQLPDKDGISAAVQIAQCAAHLASAHAGRTLEEHLDHLYARYGYHYSSNSYFHCSDQKTIRTIFRDLQTKYPMVFAEDIPSGHQENAKRESFAVSRVRDLNNGFDSGTANHKPNLPSSPNSFMVTFFIGDEITFTIRTSGTEPKIKYYSEIVAKLPEDSSPTSSESWPLSETFKGAKSAARDRLHRFLKLAIERCLRPSQHKLVAAE